MDNASINPPALTCRIERSIVLLFKTVVKLASFKRCCPAKRREMPNANLPGSSSSEGHAAVGVIDRDIQYLECVTGRLLSILDAMAKKAHQHDASRGARRLIRPVELDPSTGEDEDHDGIAADLLLGLTAATEPSTSISWRSALIGSQLGLTAKGNRRITRVETRVRPPGRVTKLLDGHWPAIRMPDVLSAMECEDMLVLFANARYPTELGDDKLAANEQKLLNFHLSHHGRPPARELLAKMLTFMSDSVGNESPSAVIKTPPEASLLASFLKQHYGVPLKRTAQETRFKSTSSEAPYVVPISDSNADVEENTDVGPSVGSESPEARFVRTNAKTTAGPDADPRRDIRQKTDGGRCFTGTEGSTGSA